MRLSMLSAGASLLLLAGCGGGETPEPEPKADVVASDDGIDTRIGGEEGSEDDAPAPESTGLSEVEKALVTRPAGTIPAEFRGRWASDDDSCAPGGQYGFDVKPDQLVFYETAARPGPVERVSDDTIRMELDYTGEGRSWTATETLTLQDPDTLERTQGDYSFTYTRCD